MTSYLMIIRETDPAIPMTAAWTDHMIAARVLDPRRPAPWIGTEFGSLGHELLTRFLLPLLYGGWAADIAHFLGAGDARVPDSLAREAGESFAFLAGHELLVVVRRDLLTKFAFRVLAAVEVFKRMIAIVRRGVLRT